MARTSGETDAGLKGKGQFYTVESIGPKREMTPEGFLLCKDVAIARTGMMVYGPEETPIKGVKGGFVKIFRNDDAVFNEATINSFNGKPVTNDHPMDDVTPENWNQLAVGVCINPRRGKGGEDDLLIADLLITNPEAIQAVLDGKREVSCGYEAEYEETGPGMGVQTNIIGNHIALVESGRCGMRCAINDHNSLKEKSMPQGKKRNALSRDGLLQLYGVKDTTELKKVLDEESETMDEDGDQHIHVHVPGMMETHDDETESRLTNLEQGHQMILAKLDELLGKKTTDSEEEEEEKDKKAKDKRSKDKKSKDESEEEEEESKSKSKDEEEEEEEEDTKDEEAEQAIKDEAPEGTEEQAVKAKDSTYLLDSWQNTKAIAEVLVPGVHIPTFDSSWDPIRNVKRMCAFRKGVLDAAYADPSLRIIFDDVLGGKPLKTKSMDCAAVRTLFQSVGSMKMAANRTAAMKTGDKGTTAAKHGIRTVAELNAYHREFYNK